MESSVMKFRYFNLVVILKSTAEYIPYVYFFSYDILYIYKEKKNVHFPSNVRGIFLIFFLFQIVF